MNNTGFLQETASRFLDDGITERLSVLELCRRKIIRCANVSLDFEKDSELITAYAGLEDAFSNVYKAETKALIEIMIKGGIGTNRIDVDEVVSNLGGALENSLKRL